MDVAEIQRVISPHADRLRPAYAALHAYVDAYQSALTAARRTPAHLDELGRHADEWERQRPEALRHAAAAVRALESAGLWTDDLDTLIDERIAQQLKSAGHAAEEIARLRTHLHAGATPRANIELALAELGASPRLDHPTAAAMTASSTAATCFYWFMTVWLAALFCVMLLGCFLVVMGVGVIVYLACAGRA